MNHVIYPTGRMYSLDNKCSGVQTNCRFELDNKKNTNRNLFTFIL